MPHCVFCGAQIGTSASFRSVPARFAHLTRFVCPPKSKPNQCCERCRKSLVGAVRVGPSLIGGAGNGLHAMRRYERNEFVTHYKGVCVLRDDVRRWPPEDTRYVLAVPGSRWALDARTGFDDDGLARYINKGVKAQNNNVRFRRTALNLTRKQRAADLAEHVLVGVYTTRVVEAGEEFYASYGNEMVKGPACNKFVDQRHVKRRKLDNND
jgi:hypothetical protein